jgi:predicted nucleic acid-binding protein
LRKSESLTLTAIGNFVHASPTYDLDDGVIEQAIKLRRQKKMKLGDAIIAATALEYDIPLVTRNGDDFKHIAGLDLRNPFSPDLPPMPGDEK